MAFRTEATDRGASILLIEDDSDLRELLQTYLTAEGYRTTAVSDGAAALAALVTAAVAPDVVVSDYDLPNGMTGLQAMAELCAQAGRAIPALIVTGDTSTTTLRKISDAGSLRLTKPVKLGELIDQIEALLAKAAAQRTAAPLLYVVDDDSMVRDALCNLLEEHGMRVHAFADGEAFLNAYREGGEACLVLDAYLPGMSGLDVLHRLRAAGQGLPVIVITGSSDVHMAVEAMKGGAIDFIEKPVHHRELLASVQRALEMGRDSSKVSAWRQDAAAHLAKLTARQHQIMNMVLAGHPSKNIAADLGISQRTVENHRAAIMRKAGTKSLPELARLALAAAGDG